MISEVFDKHVHMQSLSAYKHKARLLMKDHAKYLSFLSYGPRREKTCLRGFRNGHTQTGLLSYRERPGRVAQSVTCLATDACLTADPGVASSIPAWSHTFVEIDHDIISTVILLPSADSFKKGCCQLQAKVCAKITG